jgi:alkylhydroperoxidase family enzyme
VARTAGVSEQEIKALISESSWEQLDFNDTERSVVRLTAELLTTRGVSAALLDQVHKALGSEATIEVLMLINRWAGLALMLNALDVDLDETARLSVPTAQEEDHDD